MSVKQENEYLKMLVETQASHIRNQEETIKELRTMIDELRSLKANLEETLEEFRRQFFGVKSEKTSPVVEDTQADAEKKESIQVKSYARERKSKATRDELYGNLPVKEIICPVPDSERFCDWCNAEMIPMKPTFVREEIRITPAVVERIRYMQEVLICPECKKDQDGSFKKGTVPGALIPHSPASASAVAFVMFSKCFMGLPYYRQESAFDQLGAKIPRETLANWCIIAAEKYLLPIYERMHMELITREVIHADETTCQVLREKGKTAQSTSYMWIYASGTDGLPKIVMYEYQSGRGGIHPQEFLEGFHGLLQCDGYQGYNKVIDVLLCCCMAHCRRKFFEALPAEKKKTMKLLDINSEAAIKEPEIPESDLDKYIPAEIGVAYCNKLFYLEREFKDLPPQERKAKRLELEVTIWDNFWKWVDSLNTTKGSKLSKAVDYAQNHRDSLCNYLQDGRCELSNNAAERMAKSYAIGRKASLFHASVAGANASAILYSLVETAKANNLNVFQYIYTLLLYMPGYKNGPDGIEQLLPWSDFIKEHCSRLIDVETVTVEDHPAMTV
ncbi:IS66 family transposase [Robinsoniella peoriensis]|uniref:Transposase n=2 Tax=Robinsoniella TaxID=588605 RepID=A0A4U8Q9G3_9FIRM|nr:IS66 family transposase [Robinsoniella peoriensis]MDU7032071.1 IS66 family transposase [Clostridiales bacterium]TLD01064.1 Transposase [Robinsoniella peoriensis]